MSARKTMPAGSASPKPGSNNGGSARSAFKVTRKVSDSGGAMLPARRRVSEDALQPIPAQRVDSDVADEEESALFEKGFEEGIVEETAADEANALEEHASALVGGAGAGSEQVDGGDDDDDDDGDYARRRQSVSSVGSRGTGTTGTSASGVVRGVVGSLASSKTGGAAGMEDVLLATFKEEDAEEQQLRQTRRSESGAGRVTIGDDGGDDSDEDESEEQISEALESVGKVADAALQKELRDYISTFSEQRRLLKRAGRFSNDIASNSNQAIVVVKSDTKKIVWMNNRTQTMFGILAYQLLGENVKVLMPNKLAVVHDAYVNRYMQAWRDAGLAPQSRIVDAKEPREVIAMKWTTSGSREEFACDVMVRYMKDKQHLARPASFFVAYVSDISEQNEMKRDLKIAKVVQSKSNEAIIVADLRGSINYLNGTAESMFGLPLAFAKAHTANVRWLMPTTVAKQHDGYLSNFRHNLSSGYDMSRSTIIAKTRNLMGRRPRESGSELFPLVLRVELVDDALVAYVRDTSDVITKSEFEEALSARLFPRAIKESLLKSKRGGRTGGATESESMAAAGGGAVDTFAKKTVLVTAIDSYAAMCTDRSADEVFSLINAMYVRFDKILSDFCGDLVTRTGEGVVAVFGLSGNRKAHADRAVYSALKMIEWCAVEAKMKLRVGAASGDVGSGVFGDVNGRQQWMVWGAPVERAKELVKAAEPSTLLVARSMHEAMQDRRFSGGMQERAGGGGAYVLRVDSVANAAGFMEKARLLISREQQSIQQRERELKAIREGAATMTGNDVKGSRSSSRRSSRG